MGKKSLYQYSQTSDLLLSIADLFGNAMEMLPYFLTYRGQRVVAYYGPGGLHIPKEIERRRRQQKVLHELKKRKLIVAQRESEKYKVALTEDGLYQVFRLRVLKANMLPKDKVCMVVFDIPETQRNLRQMLRRFLAEAGFVPIQRSVWISPVDAGEQLACLFKAAKATKWVRVYNSERFL